MPRVRTAPGYIPSGYGVPGDDYDPEAARRQAMARQLMGPQRSSGGGSGETPKITHPLQGVAHVMGQMADAIGQRRAAEQEMQARGLAADLVMRAYGGLPGASGGQPAAPAKPMSSTFAASGQGYTPNASAGQNRTTPDAVYGGLVQRGIPSIVAAGMTGNIAAESNFRTNIADGRGEGSVGLIQARGPRLTALQQLGAQTGRDPFSLDNQLDHIAQELQGSERKAFDIASQAKTPGDAAYALAKHYERPAAWALRDSAPRRMGVAEDVYGRLGQQRAQADIPAAGSAPVSLDPMGNESGFTIPGQEPPAPLPPAVNAREALDRAAETISVREATAQPIIQATPPVADVVAPLVQTAMGDATGIPSAPDPAPISAGPSLVEPGGLGFTAPTPEAPSPDLSGTSWLPDDGPSFSMPAAPAASPLLTNPVERSGDAFAARLASPAIASVPGELPLMAPSAAPPVPTVSAAPPVQAPVSMDVLPNAAGLTGSPPGASNLPVSIANGIPPTTSPTDAAAPVSVPTTGSTEAQRIGAMLSAPLPPPRPADLVAPGAQPAMLPPQGAPAVDQPTAPQSRGQALGRALMENPNSEDAGAGAFARSGAMAGNPVQNFLDGIFGGPETQARLKQGLPVSATPYQQTMARALAGEPASTGARGASAPAQPGPGGAPGPAQPGQQSAAPQAPGFFEGLSRILTGGGAGNGPSAAQLSQMPHSDVMRMVQMSPYIDGATKRDLIERTYPKGVSINGNLVNPVTGAIMFSAPKGLTSVAPGTTLFDQDARAPVFTAPTRPETTTEQRNYRAAQDDPEFGRFLSAAKEKGHQRVEIDNADGTKRTMFLGPDSRLRTPEELGAPAYTPTTPANPYAIGGSGGKPMTEGQSKDVGFANRMVGAHNIVNGLEQYGTKGLEQGLSRVPMVGNYLTSDEVQRYNQGKSQFITSMLRKDSGAAIGKDEFDRYDKEYFPQPGESAGLIEQKRRARETAIESLMAGAGPSYKPPAEYRPLPRGETQQVQGGGQPGPSAPQGRQGQEAPQQAQPGQPMGRGDGSSQMSPMDVTTPDDLARLKPGQFYRRPDGGIGKKR